MNVLVTGANGQLGNEIRIVAHDSKDNYNGSSRKPGA